MTNTADGMRVQQSAGRGTRIRSGVEQAQVVDADLDHVGAREEAFEVARNAGRSAIACGRQLGSSSTVVAGATPEQRGQRGCHRLGEQTQPPEGDRAGWTRAPRAGTSPGVSCAGRGPFEVEAVVRDSARIDLGQRQRRRRLGRCRDGERDAGIPQRSAQPAPERVIADPAQELTRAPEPGDGPGDVERAAAGMGGDSPASLMSMSISASPATVIIPPASRFTSRILWPRRVRSRS